MAEDLGQEAKLEKPRKVPVRSVYLFPAYDFSVAKQIAERVEQDGGGKLSEHTLARAMEQSVKSSAFQLRVLTARQFGLVIRHDKEVETTTLAKAILKPLAPDERFKGMAEAFMNIPLFKVVAERYKGRPLPHGQDFRNVLEREFQVQPDRVPDAERKFLDSARETNVLVSQGGLQYLVTDEVVPSSSSPHPPPTNGHITPPPPVQASTNPQTAAIQHGGATAPGNFLTFTEEDFAEVGEDEFAEAWAAIGKVVRARGFRIARERERIDQETIRSPIASHVLDEGDSE